MNLPFIALRLAIRRNLVPKPYQHLERFAIRRTWVANLEAKIVRASPPRGLQYSRSVLSPNALYFRNSEPSGELVIGFGPRVRRLTVSMPVFLAALGSTGHDFLFIRPDQDHQFPWLELDSFPGGLPGLVAGLRSFATNTGYRAWHTIGLSFSAPLALAAGILIGASTVTPIGLTRSFTLLEPQAPGVWKNVRSYLESGQNCQNQKTQFVYGENDLNDRQVAFDMAKEIKRSVTVPVQNAGHSPLGKILEARELHLFLSEVTAGFPNIREHQSFTVETTK